MNKINELIDKKERFVIGLMSGTSVDGIDAALVRIKGNYKETQATLLAFENYPYPKGIRERIFRLFEDDTSSSQEICHMNFLLGELFASGAIRIAKKAGIPISHVDLIGSHGQTIYHIPKPISDCGYEIRSTFQIGEGAVIAHRTGVVTISDFRVMDMAAGGQGAPLVPYTEYLLYGCADKTIALQNIGGVGNITVLPNKGGESDVIAFDTGPGNMVMDAVVTAITDGRLHYDEGGRMGGSGRVSEGLLGQLLLDPYFHLPPPKTTGREYFGSLYAAAFIKKGRSMGLSDHDLVATATALTSESIALSCSKFIPYTISQLVIGGGGSYNPVLVSMIAKALPHIEVLTQEDMGYSSDAKEAIAFAVLANEAMSLNTNNLPSATGAVCKKILGKISL